MSCCYAAQRVYPVRVACSSATDPFKAVCLLSQVTAYRAGHVLGACMFEIEIAGMRLLYTGDYSRVPDRHLSAADTPDNPPHIGEQSLLNPQHTPAASLSLHWRWHCHSPSVGIFAAQHAAITHKGIDRWACLKSLVAQKPCQVCIASRKYALSLCCDSSLVCRHCSHCGVYLWSVKALAKGPARAALC